MALIFDTSSMGLLLRRFAVGFFAAALRCDGNVGRAGMYHKVRTGPHNSATNPHRFGKATSIRS